MTVRMRHTSGHTKNRRSHHGLTAPRLSRCPKCGSFHLRHRACEVCGEYRNRLVIDVNTKIEKKNERRKAKLKELGKDPNHPTGDGRDPNAKPEGEKKAVLDATKLSKKTKK